MLAIYPQVGPTNTCIQLWIGILDSTAPSAPRVWLPKVPAAVVSVVDGLQPIRDDFASPAGKPLNHRTIVRIDGLQPGTPYEISVSGGGETRSLNASTLPREIGGNWFNILMSSCYYQPEDASGTLGNVLSKILVRADMTLMMGDQIYGDLPLDVDLPGGYTIASMLGSKYLRNFASRSLESGGLTSVLQRAPTICVADDHEYWNNYPFPQAQLPNTWTVAGRKAWANAARALYEDYQLGAGVKPGFARRVDIHPVKMLIVDTRSDRDEKFIRLIAPTAESQVSAWAEELLADRSAGKPAFGLLCSGQALFARRTPDSQRKSHDAELCNWDQFDELFVGVLKRLSAAGIPVIYLTGDVHWGRVAQARDTARHGEPMIYEVITSPSTLIRVPIRDRGLELWEGAKGIFGQGKRWPRHFEPEEAPSRLGQSPRYRLQRTDKQPGDQVAVLSMRRAGGGIDFRVTYFEVSGRSSGADAYPTLIYSMRNF